MNRLLLHIALLLCAPRSFGYAIRTGLISAFAMRLYRQNKRKVFGDYKSLYSKRSDNISARTGEGFYSVYTTPGTLDYNADIYAFKRLGYYYKNYRIQYTFP